MDLTPSSTSNCPMAPHPDEQGSNRQQASDGRLQPQTRGFRATAAAAVAAGQMINALALSGVGSEAAAVVVPSSPPPPQAIKPTTTRPAQHPKLYALATTANTTNENKIILGRSVSLTPSAPWPQASSTSMEVAGPCVGAPSRGLILRPPPMVFSGGGGPPPPPQPQLERFVHPNALARTQSVDLGSFMMRRQLAPAPPPNVEVAPGPPGGSSSNLIMLSNEAANRQKLGAPGCYPPPPSHLQPPHQQPVGPGQHVHLHLATTVKQEVIEPPCDPASSPLDSCSEERPSTSLAIQQPKSEIVSSRTILEFDGNDQVLCRVCGDKASGFHYGVHSCEGCKGFFRRSIQQKIQYRPCTKNQQCNILRINRNRCQYCRLKKCIAAGMSRDAVRFGRVPKREKAKILAAMQSSRMKTQEAQIMSEMSDQGKIIETIVRAHYDTCDFTRNKIEPFIQKAKADQVYFAFTGLTCPMKGHPDEAVAESEEEFSDRFMDLVRQVCTFAKIIPGFKCLHHDDQVTLLKSCVFEVLLVRLAGLFDNQHLVCLSGELISRESITHMPSGNAKFLMDSVFGLAHRMNNFRLSDAEIGLFCAVVIITADRPGLRNPEMVHKMQTKLKQVFNNILLPQHPDQATIFSELMKMIHDLRTLNTLHMEKFLQLFKVNPDDSVDQSMRNPSEPARSKKSRSSATTQSRNPEQDSTGNESPQSYSSSEDTRERRSPIGSVSSSENAPGTAPAPGSMMTVNDIRVSLPNSVLISALTSTTSGSSGSAPEDHAQEETAPQPRPSARQQQQPQQPHQGRSKQYKSTNVLRKLESPTDSGIDSPLRVQGSQSSSTSVCSSPRSTTAATCAADNDNVKKEPLAAAAAAVAGIHHHHHTLTEQSRSPKPHFQVLGEAERAAAAAAAATHAEAESLQVDQHAHPLLKRALEQPPQQYNLGNSSFQDEVYKPHKKFRRSDCSAASNNGRGDEPSSSSMRTPPPSSSSSSAQPGPSSLLASQLLEPPMPSVHSSLLASTLTRRTPLCTPNEYKLRDMVGLAILEPSRERLLMVSNHYQGVGGGQPRCPQGGTYRGGGHRQSVPSATVTSGSYEEEQRMSEHPHHQNSKLASLADAALAAAAAAEHAQQRRQSQQQDASAQPLNLSTGNRESADISTEA